MKRLLEEADPTLSALTATWSRAPSGTNRVRSPSATCSRGWRALALEGGAGKRLFLRPALLGMGALLLAATAAAAGYSWLAPTKAPSTALAPAAVVAAQRTRAPSAAVQVAPPLETAPLDPVPSVDPPSLKQPSKLQAGEDPSQVAEAVRALRKQGDPARAQALLDQYLKANPHGALAEDALALSIEAAAARKGSRAPPTTRAATWRATRMDDSRASPNARSRAERAASSVTRSCCR